jgi:hypothetical protein
LALMIAHENPPTVLAPTSAEPALLPLDEVCSTEQKPDQECLGRSCLPTAAGATRLVFINPAHTCPSLQDTVNRLSDFYLPRLVANYQREPLAHLARHVLQTRSVQSRQTRQVRTRSALK